MLRRLFRQTNSDPIEKAAGPAYDLWASSYDFQPGNLVFDMDDDLFLRFLGGVDVGGCAVADIGCGTGRHWPGILAKNPSSLSGYDVSEGMLARLRMKFPRAHTERIGEDGLAPLRPSSVDLLLSTLALAHIADMEPALAAWAEALKPGGYLLLTDFHPDALLKGAKRTFIHKGQSVLVRSYVHPVPAVEQAALDNGLVVVQRGERLVDDDIRHYYEQKGALATFEKFKGVPMVYGLLCKKL